MDSPIVISAVNDVLEEYNNNNRRLSYVEFMRCIHRIYIREPLGITIISFIKLIMQYKKNNK